MKTIGIKLADGSFYPVLEEGTPKQKNLELTTAHNNQTKVMVDLYRSANCTMEDAEYVDSLQIENLNAHPTGEADISFTVAIDEDNQLSANILDEETGKESGTTITLVSRTLEERLVTDEYKLADYGITPKKSGGLLAAASRLRDADGVENEMGEPDIEETAVEDQSFTDFNLGDPDAITSEDDLDDVLGDNGQPTIDAKPFTAEDFNFDEEPEVEKETEAEINIESENEPAVETAEESSGFVSDDLPDFNLDNLEPTPMEEKPVEESEPELSVETSSEPTIESTDDVFATESEIVTETAIESTDDVFETEESSELPDFSFDDADTTTIENETTDDIFETESEIVTETSDNTDSFNIDSDLPDFNFDETESETTTETSDDIFATEESSELPDFSFDDAETTIETSDNIFETETAESSELNFDDQLEESTADTFDLPDFGDISSDTSFSEEDALFSDSSNDDIPTSGGISFTGLYDKETELGESANYDEEETSKKTRVPVIICIICAIICVIATALILFIIPSKYNLINKKAEKEQTTEIVQNEPEPEPVVEEYVEPEPEPIPEAKEDEVIIIEKAEEVVPEQPPVVEEKPKDITYKIRWGDTLWDISNTYYKNPWRYKDIARYNKIKDPDYIVSGTIITIPAE